MALEMQSFDMEANDAGLTLKEFARQAKAGIVFDPERVKGVRTKEVTGMLLPSEALGRMLEGTPLVFKQDVESGAFAVTRVAIPSIDTATQFTEPETKEETEMVTGQPEVGAREGTEGSMVELERFEMRSYPASLWMEMTAPRPGRNRFYLSGRSEGGREESEQRRLWRFGHASIEAE